MSFLLVFGVSCGLGLALIPLARALARRYGLVDRPDGRRKIHARPIPVAGGPALLLATVGALVVALLWSQELSSFLKEQAFSLCGLLLAAIFICALGVADDDGRLRGRHKLLGQLAAVLVLTQFSWVIHSISVFGWQVDLGILAIPFTVLWLLGTINSLNLLDGMDGLLGTVGGLLSLALAGLALYEERWAAAAVGLALAGGLAAFLRYNLPPASIFLGDSGSMLIGLLVGALAIQGGGTTTEPLPLAIPIVLFTIPFLDTFAAILRRKLTGRSIYTTDRGHLHHYLLRQGYSTRGVLLLIACFSLFLVAGVASSIVFRQEWIAMLATAALVLFLIVTKLFGNAEFKLVRNRCAEFVHAFLRRPVQEDGRQMIVQLQGSVNWEELWCNLVGGTKHMNLTMMRLNVNAPALHEGYHARWDSRHGAAEEGTVWSAEIPLIVDGRLIGRLEVIGQPCQQPFREKMETLLKLVEYFEIEASDLLHAKMHPPAVAETVEGRMWQTVEQEVPKSQESAVRSQESVVRNQESVIRSQ